MGLKELSFIIILILLLFICVYLLFKKDELKDDIYEKIGLDLIEDENKMKRLVDVLFELIGFIIVVVIFYIIVKYIANYKKI